MGRDGQVVMNYKLNEFSIEILNYANVNIVNCQLLLKGAKSTISFFELNFIRGDIYAYISTQISQSAYFFCRSYTHMKFLSHKYLHILY